MARDFGPFPSGPMYEVVNRRMQRALAEAAASTGFARSGQGAVTAGTGAQLVIAAYPDGALVDGLWVENPASETVTVTTNTASTNPRIDRLVMRLDMGAETIAPFQIVGTPAASPSAPPLVKTATVVDMPLVRYTFPGSASAQNPGSIVDERLWLIKSAPPVNFPGGSGWTSVVAGYGTPKYYKDDSGIVHGMGAMKYTGTAAVNPVAGILPVGFRPLNQVAPMVVGGDAPDGVRGVYRIDIGLDGSVKVLGTVPTNTVLFLEQLILNPDN